MSGDQEAEWKGEKSKLNSNGKVCSSRKERKQIIEEGEGLVLKVPVRGKDLLSY